MRRPRPAFAPSSKQQEKPGGLRWQGMVALILGAILLACGVALFVSAHWDEIGPGARFAIVIAMVAVFHLAGGLVRKSFLGLSTTLHAVGTLSTGAAIALVGQIFNIQEHWPAAVLMWALAALAGWMLLRDQAQQTLTLLLFPAWISPSWRSTWKAESAKTFILAASSSSGLFFTSRIFLGSKRRIVQGFCSLRRQLPPLPARL